MNEHLIYFIHSNFICGTFKWQVVVSGSYICFFHKYIKRINYTGILRGKCTIQKAHVYQNISFILVAFLTQRNRSGMLKTCVSEVSKTVV